MFKLKLLLIAALIPKQVSFTLGMVLMSPFRLLLIGLLPWILFELLARRRFSWCAADILAIVVSLWPVIALFFSSSALTSVESGGIYFLEIFVPYFLVRQVVTSYSKLYSLVKFLLLLVGLLALSALPELITGKHFIHDFLDRVFGGVTDIRSGKRFGLSRSLSVTDHPIIFGSICSIGFVLSLSLVMRSKKYIAYSGLSFLGVFASLSSAPLLAVLSQFLLFLWGRILSRFRYKWVLLVILVAFLYLLIDIASNRPPIKVAFSYLLFSPHNGYVRYEMWVNSIFLINQSIFVQAFGYGLSGIPFDLIENKFFAHVMKSSVDSFWMINLLRYGWPMFLLWAAMIFMAIKQSRIQYKKMMRGSYEKIISESWLILAISFTLISLSVDFWGGMKSIFIVIIAGLCINTGKVKRNNKTTK